MLSYSTSSYSIKGKQTERLNRRFSKFVNYVNPCSPVYVMDKSFIRITRPDSTFIQKECDGCFSISSSDSDVFFRLFIFGKFGFFQKLPKCQIPLLSLSKAHHIPQQIRYFVHTDSVLRPPPSSADFPSDPDFELMFSRTDTTLIGSYADTELSALSHRRLNSKL